jgi:hypothetical protein
MSSTITIEEINVLKKKLELMRIRIKKDRNEATHVLHLAGIVNKAGEFIGPYKEIFKK